VRAQDLTSPSAPAALAGKLAGGALTLTWIGSVDNTGVDHYVLYLDGTPVARIPGTTTTVTLRTFKPKGQGVYSIKAVDAAGNVSPVALSTVTVRHLARPKGTPRAIPRWAWRLFHWQQTGKGKKPKTPTPLPHWYRAWKAWRLEPFAIVR
jgi:hypothetical protein